MRGSARVGRRAHRLPGPVGVFLGWWYASAGSQNPYFPPLRDVLSTFRHTWIFADVKPDLLPSLERMFVGFALAAVVGVSTGVVLGRHTRLRQAFNPLVQFGRSIPGTALVPIGIVLLGIGNLTKIWVIGFVCLFPIILNAIDGVRSVDPLQLDMAATFGLSSRQQMQRVILPSAMPQIMVGMRISLALAFIMMVVTEMVSATNGIGYVTLTAESQYETPQMWAGMLLLGILGYAFNLLFVSAERRILRWHYGRRLALEKS